MDTRPRARDAADRVWLADWRRRVAALYVEVRADRGGRPGKAVGARWRAEREALFRTHPQSPVPAGGPRRLPRAATGRTTRASGSRSAVDRPAAAPSFGGGLAIALPNSGDGHAGVRPGRHGPAAAPRRRGVARRVLDARLRGRPVPALPRRHERRRDVRRRPLRCSTRRRARTSVGTRRAGTLVARPQLRLPAVVRVRPEVGVPASRHPRTGSRRGSRPASGSAEHRARYHGRHAHHPHDADPGRCARSSSTRWSPRSRRSTPTAPRARRSSGTGSSPTTGSSSTAARRGGGASTSCASRASRSRSSTTTTSIAGSA